MWWNSIKTLKLKTWAQSGGQKLHLYMAIINVLVQESAKENIVSLIFFYKIFTNISVFGTETVERFGKIFLLKIKKLYEMRQTNLYQVTILKTDW